MRTQQPTHAQTGAQAHPLMTQGKALMGASRTLKRASEVKTTGGVSWRPISAYSPNVARLNSRLVAALQQHHQRGTGVTRQPERRLQRSAARTPSARDDTHQPLHS